ncbi:MAG TPA: hypothetical protein VN699_10775, partial [Pirellulales bacterium]|nr:hypothetical protein [Pirellulales bacterium]
ANFDFLHKPAEVESEAAPDVEEAAQEVEEDSQHDDDMAGQDDDELAGLDVSAAPPEHAEADAEAPDEGGLDFLAEEVKPAASAHAPTFSFLNSAPVEPAEASAPEEEFAPPEAEPVAAEDSPSFGFLGADADDSAAAEPTLDFTDSAATEAEEGGEHPLGEVDSLDSIEEAPPSEAVAPAEEAVAEEVAAEAFAEEASAESTFSEETPAADMPPVATSDSDEMAGLDFLRDEGPAEGAAKDDAPSFGFLGALESTATPDDADSQPLDLTLHDPESEGEEVAAVDSDSPIASIDRAELNFDEGMATPAPENSGDSTNDMTLPFDAESADADEDSGEFALPVEPAAASDDDRGVFKFIDASPAVEGAEADEAADEDSAEYAISLEPHATPPLGSPGAEEESADNDAGFNFLEDAAPPATAEDDRLNDDRPNDEDDSAAAMPPLTSASADADEESAAEPGQDKKRSWWRIGKAKDAKPAKEKTKSKAAKRPVIQPSAVVVPSPQQDLGSATKPGQPPLDPDEAALDFLADETPAPSIDAKAKPSSAAEKGKPAEQAPQIQVGTEKAKADAPEDDELNNFFESIGLD